MTGAMTRGKLIIGADDSVTFVLAGQGGRGRRSQAPPVATFKSSVDMVRIAAVVRDHKGRFVQDLTARDFEVLDGGQTRPITDFQRDLAGVSVAVLFDVSGSMEGHMPNAREAATHVLSWLDATRDEAAIYTFDTHLDERTPFTTGLQTLPGVDDAASCRSARRRCTTRSRRRRARVGEREGRRRAVVVLTDGADNASRLTAGGRVGDRQRDRRAGLHLRHRAVDRQPVGGHLDAFGRAHRRSPVRWPISPRGPADTSFVASTPGQRSIAARQIIDELRHQYLIAFESSGKPGWHPLVVRARNKDLIVRARSGYIAGQSRPTAH